MNKLDKASKKLDLARALCVEELKKLSTIVGVATDNGYMYSSSDQQQVKETDLLLQAQSYVRARNRLKRLKRDYDKLREN